MTRNNHLYIIVALNFILYNNFITMEIYFEISEYFEIYFILFGINENLLLKSDIKIKYDEINEIIIPN